MAGTLTLLLAAGLAMGCSSARQVTRGDDGGTLVLRGPRYNAKLDAHEKMTAHCGGPYTVVSEEAGGAHVGYVCGQIPGRAHSQYAPVAPITNVPNASAIGLE